MKLSAEPLEVKEFGDRILVIYKWDDLTDNSCPRVWENVELFDRQGKKIWTVNGMERSKYWNNNIDVFVGVVVKNGRVELISFSGNSYELNMDTGEVAHSSFHK